MLKVMVYIYRKLAMPDGTKIAFILLMRRPIVFEIVMLLNNPAMHNALRGHGYTKKDKGKMSAWNPHATNIIRIEGICCH